jgi:hypothetical protein
MNTAAETLAARRQRLIAQAAYQRAELSHQMAPWRARLAVADRGVALVRTAGRHPLLLTGVAVLLALWRPRRAVQWLQYGWVGWQMARQLRSAWSENKTAP